MNFKPSVFSLKSLGTFSLTTVLLLTALGSISLAAKERLLGQTRISFGTDFDYLAIANDCDRPSVSAMKIKVLKAPAEINSISIRYGNNKTEQLPVRKNFAKNSESKWFDLKGDRRCVKAVAVLGKTKNQASKEALVQFYGR